MQKKTTTNILKECFWEYNFSEEDIVSMAYSSDKREQVFLFTKIDNIKSF